MFSKRLRELRTARGITQADFAREIGVSPGAVGLWEQGRREPDYDHLRRIARYFSVSTDFLLGDSVHFVQAADEHRIVNMYRTLSDADRAALARMIAALFAQQQHAL